MCWNCGCKAYDDDMGHPENITTSKVKSAADAEGQSMEDAMRNMGEAIAELGKGDKLEHEEA